MELPSCPNCGSAMREGDAYCASCGQATIGKEDMRGFVDQFLGDYFTFDSKIIRSLVPLLTSPGKLTAEYLAGRRARYIPPLRMFIFLSILFFLVFGLSGSAPDANTPLEDLEDRVFWDRFFTSILPKLFFLFLPLFAFLVSVFYRDRPLSFVKPFIFSAHFHAFVFLTFTLYGLLSRALASAHLVRINWVLIIGVLLYTVYYLWSAIRRIYPRPIGRHTLKFMALTTCYVLLLVSAAITAAWGLR